jgi:hypothetical protein
VKKVVQKKRKKVVRHRSIYKPRGVSKVVLLGVVAVVLLAAGGGIFVMNQQKGGSVSIPSLIKPALNPTCKYNDPELCKFMNNMQTHTEYSVTTTSDIAKMKMETVMELAGENKFHMLSKQNGKENSNMISIGDTTYTLDYKDNKWWKQTLKPNVTKTPEKELKDQYTFKGETAEDKTTYKFIAKEACGDKMCFKYEMVNPDTTDAQMFIWFDDQEYVMRKMRIETKGEGSSESVYTYGGVNISAPSPVKEGEPNSFGGAAMPNASDPEVQKMMKEYEKQMPANEAPADTTNTDSADESSDQ